MAFDYRFFKAPGAPIHHPILRHALLLFLCAWNSAGHAIENLPFALAEPFLAQRPLVLDGTDRRWLAERKVLRVGVSIADHEPIDITSDRNRYQGISADYLSMISARLSIPVQVQAFAKREDAVAALRSGAIDMLSGASGYERAITGLTFTQTYMPDKSVVVARGTDSSLLPSLRGKRVLLLEGYVDSEQAHRLYPDSEILLAPSLYSAVEALAHGEADAVIGNELIVRAYSVLRPYLGLQIKFISLIPPGGFSFALRERDSRLTGLINRAMAGLDESVSHQILERWTSGLGTDVIGQRLNFNAAEQLWIRKHPQVVVASTQHPPYIYKDDKGRWVGLNVDLLSRISRMTGLMFVYEEAPSTRVLLETLTSGSAHMNTTLAETPERKTLLNFTYAFGGNNWVFLVPANDPSPVSLAQMSGKVLALPARHALLEYVQTSYPDILLRLVPTYEEARQAVEDGDAHFTIQNEAGAWLYTSDRLKVGRSVEGKWSSDSFSVIKSEPELLGILNKALEEFPVAEMRAIRMKWLGTVSAPPSVWQRIPAWVYWGASIVLLLGLVSLAWRSRLQVQIHRRRRAEEQLSDQLAFKRALFDGIPDPLYVRDLQGRLISCNRGYEAFFGISHEQMNGRRVIDVDLVPQECAAHMHADYMTLLETQKPLQVERSMNLFGRQIEARQWSVPFYRADGQLQGLLGGWVDCTERKRLERELLLAQQNAAVADQVVSTFLATMRYEFHAPMASIIELLEKEQARLAGQPVSQTLDRVCESTRELLTRMDKHLNCAAEPDH